MLSSLICGSYDKKVALDNLDSFIPHVYMHDNHLKNYPRPRIIKSHEVFNPRYPKVIYIIRDPRDVAVSYYHYWIRRTFMSDDYSIDNFIQDFLNNRIDKRYGTWKENVASWLAAKNNTKNFLLLRYEKILESPEVCLKSVSKFIGLRVTQNTIKTTVKLSSIKQMKLLERHQPRWENRINVRLDKPFFRKGIEGIWRKELPHKLALQIEEEWWKIMMHVSYELVYANKPGYNYLPGFIGSIK